MDSALTAILAALTSDQMEHWRERAAIMEYDGEMPRQQAEWAALDQVRKWNT